MYNFHMRSLYLLLVTAGLLTACIPAAADLTAAREQAIATVSAADVRLAATRQAVTLAAVSTADASRLYVTRLAAEGRGTATSQAAAFARDQATRQAVATATAYPWTATALAVTQQVQLLQVTAQAAAIQRDETITALGWMALILMVGAFGGVAVYGAYLYSVRRNSLIVTPAGVAFLYRTPDGWAAELLAARVEQHPIKWGGLYARSSLPAAAVAPRIEAHREDEQVVIVRRLVQDAIAQAGEGADTIPSWRKLEGWTSGPWQKAVRILEANKLIYTDPGKGTFITEDVGDLAELAYQLNTMQLKLHPPTPREGVSG